MTSDLHRPRPIHHALFLTLLTLVLVGAGDLHAETVPFSSSRWEIQGGESRIEPFLGKESLYLKGGLAWLRDVEMTDGIIEFDVAMTGERGFMGAVWRFQDPANYEEFYIRPHQSGNPDANQYTPIFNGVPGWQLYHGEGYGAPVEYRANAWIHIRIVISGTRGEVFIDSEEPVLAIHEMKRGVAPGKIGVVVANFAYAHFADFTFTPMEKPALKSKAPAAAKPPPGTVGGWLVSTAFDEKSMDGKVVLTEADTRDLSWEPAAAESTGTLNIARVRALAERKDTVFTRLTIHSDLVQVKRLSFGYSDRVRAWFNGRLIYGGTNFYRSRDYRYLGTIGLFDELYLPLKEGRNELWMAVSESFGGWGIQARFEDDEGITLDWTGKGAEKAPAGQ